MLNNFIYAKTKDLFLKELEAGNVLDEAIVFIEDTKEIWNHGTYFDGKPVDVPTRGLLKTYTFLIDGNGTHWEYTITQEELEKIQNADIVYFFDGTKNIQLTAKGGTDHIDFYGYDLNLYPDTVKIFSIAVFTSLKVTIDLEPVLLSDYISDYIGESQSSYVIAMCEEIVDGAYIEIVENGDVLSNITEPISLVLVDSYNNVVSLIGPYIQSSENALNLFKFIGEYNDLTIECVLDVSSILLGTLHIKSKSEGADLSDYVTKEELNSKQDIISDIETIRQGAAKGATALQSYNEQYKGTVTGVKVNGTTKNPSNGVVDLGTVITSHQDISGKQDKLVSGTNIKTINGTSILGNGDIVISSGDSSSGSGSGAYSEVNHGTSDITFTLTPNTFHVWDEVSSLTLTIGSETSGVANEYLFQFTSGSEPTTLILPDSIKFNSDFTIEANKKYQISILNGLGTVMSWDI